MNLSVPHSILGLRDPSAIAIMCMLARKPEGGTVTAKEAMDFLKIGRQRFYTARKLLTENDFITEVQKLGPGGKFSGVTYRISDTVYLNSGKRQKENKLIKIQESPDNTPAPATIPETGKREPAALSKTDNSEVARSVQLDSNNKNSSDKIKTSNPDANSKNKTSNPDASDKSISSKSNSNSTFSREFEYPKSFSRLWILFVKGTLGNQGTKAEAYTQFKKLKLRDNDLEWLLQRISHEIHRKQELRKTGQFDPNFPHVCRILKYRAWESWPAPSGPLPTSSQQEVIL